MKLRLLITTHRDEWPLRDYVPQSECVFYEREVEIPQLPEGWIVRRVSVMEAKEE